jgi:hypothetical protein
MSKRELINEIHHLQAYMISIEIAAGGLYKFFRRFKFQVLDS